MRIRLWCTALALALPLAAWAQDPPGRVGRLAEVRGTAWLTPATGERASAFLNRPLTQGDRLVTDAGARVEVQVGSAVLRVAERSDLTFTRLDDTHVEVLLAGGSLALRVRQPELARELLVRTPDASVAPQGAGLARVDRFGRGSYAWAVEGQWQVRGQQGDWQMLSAGQRLELWRGADGRERIEAAVLPHEGDAFERWARQDGASWNSADAGVSSEMTGVQDLDRYGSWRQSSDYGAIWFPSQVGAGWSPYSQGQWAWVAPWGWTWVDAMPWGFAPFHYGRWVYLGNQWGWTPGPDRGPRPVYAPALAGAVSGAFSNTPGTPPSGGWRPLQPGQRYVPAYRASSAYVQSLNAGVVGAVAPGGLPNPRQLLIGKPRLVEAAPPAPPPARVVNPVPAPLQPAPGRTLGTTAPAAVPLAPAPLAPAAPQAAPAAPLLPALPMAVPGDRRDGAARPMPAPPPPSSRDVREPRERKPDADARNDRDRGRLIR